MGASKQHSLKKKICIVRKSRRIHLIRTYDQDNLNVFECWWISTKSPWVPVLGCAAELYGELAYYWDFWHLTAH